MTRTTVCVVLLCLAVAVFNIHSVEGRSISEDKMNIVAKCVYGKKEYEVGEKWSALGECNIYTCIEGGSISGLTCGLAEVSDDSHCTFTEMDLKTMYPKCCPQMVCPPE